MYAVTFAMILLASPTSVFASVPSIPKTLLRCVKHASTCRRRAALTRSRLKHCDMAFDQAFRPGVRHGKTYIFRCVFGPAVDDLYSRLHLRFGAFIIHLGYE